MSAAHTPGPCGQVNSGDACDMQRVGDERVCPDCNPGRVARLIQAEREAAELANHKERLEWLSADAPTWSDGVRVDAHIRQVMLLQSRAAIAKANGSAAS